MLRIDLYTDITCPWCIVGQHRLDKVLAERFADLIVDIRHYPVLLLPDTPNTGLYIPDLLRSRYGVTDPSAAFARPEAEASASGLDLRLNRQLWTYPTQPAHALIRAAGKRGTQHSLAVAISKAYFLDARNIADVDVLAAIGEEHGFEHAEARAIALDPNEHELVAQESARSASVGVRMVPHIVFGSSTAITGGRSEDEIAASIDAAVGFNGTPVSADRSAVIGPTAA